MTRYFKSFFSLVLLIGILASSGCRGRANHPSPTLPAVSDAPAVETPTRPDTTKTATTSSARGMETGITIFDRNAVDVDWSRDGQWIAYARLTGADKYSDIWLSKPDGSGRQCLTCGKIFSRRQRGSVTQQPGGDYIVFTTENDDVTGVEAEKLSSPGLGMNTNLWATTRDGSQVWKLTDIPTDYNTPGGVIHPQFSRDGKRLIWSEAVGHYGSPHELAWGEWTIVFADFTIVNGAPKLQNIVKIQPGEQHAFYETHDWSPDDHAILFSGNLKKGQPVNAIDIYEYDIATGRLKQLTNTPGDWDEHAHYSPDGQTIVWMSGAELNVQFPEVRDLAWQKYVKTELWAMNRGGSNPRRISFFNQSGSPDWEWFQKNVFMTNRVVVSDSTSSPEGKRVAVNLAYEGPDSALYGNVRSVLVILDLVRTDGSIQNIAAPLPSESR